MNITSSDDQAFLKRLTAIVEANLDNEQFGVNELAVAMKISRSQIHRKLKSINNQSISQFIREVRLKNSKELLGQNEFTVSEIAYKVGFGSPSYFIKSFHDYFGYPPGEYVKYAYTDSRNFRNTVNYNNVINTLWRLKTGKLLIWLVSLFIIISTFFSIYFVVQSRNKKEPVEKSLVVLPLKYNGNDENVIILAEGVMEDILNRLSGVSGLSVKSSKTAEIYGNVNKMAPEIAKELRVSYVLTGTVLKIGEIVQIYIQLIDAINDKNIWSGKYEENLSGILEFVSAVSKQVAEHINDVLTKNEIEQIKKVYTENTQSYQLYLKGRYFLNRRTKEDVYKSVDYFNQALELDTNYSLAWAGLADSYYTLTWWGFIPEPEGLTKSKECIRKSMDIDFNLAEAHVVLGGIANWYDKDWIKAEKELQLAIELNPNYAMAYFYYAEILEKRGKFKEAIELCNKAINLNPNVITMYAIRARNYYNEGKYIEALNNTEKAKELNTQFEYAYLLNFKIYVRLGEDLKAIDELENYFSIFHPEFIKENLFEKIYSQSGMTGIIHWAIDWIPKNPVYKGLIPQLYSLAGERDSVLLVLERNIVGQNDSTTKKFPIKYVPDYKIIHDDPRFTEIIKKLGLEDL